MKEKGLKTRDGCMSILPSTQQVYIHKHLTAKTCNPIYQPRVEYVCIYIRIYVLESSRQGIIDKRLSGSNRNEINPRNRSKEKKNESPLISYPMPTPRLTTIQKNPPRKKNYVYWAPYIHPIALFVPNTINK
jgi:hypothetical protein